MCKTKRILLTFNWQFLACGIKFIYEINIALNVRVTVNANKVLRR